MANYQFPQASAVITKVQRLVGEIAAPQVQEFSESQYYDHLTRTFNMLFTKYPWESYRRWQTVTLNGTNGKIVTAPFGDVRNFTDFLGVYLAGKNTRLPTLPTNINPNVLTGTTPQFWTGLPVTDNDYLLRRLQFWPLAATGDVNILVRVHPGEIQPQTVLYIDQDLLEFGCAWQILEDEGTNDAGATRAQFLFDDRWRSLMNAYADTPIEAGTRGSYPTKWIEHP